jgi:hypothetical protein
MFNVRHLALVVFACAACAEEDDPTPPTDTPADNGPYDVVFNGDTSYNAAHAGRTVYISVRTQAGVEVASDDAVIGASGFAFTFTNVLTKDTSYNVDYYVDVDSDGACVGATDHVWRTAISTAAANFSVTDAHDLTFTTAACASFPLPGQTYDLTFAGDTSYGDLHEDDGVFIAVLEDLSGDIVATDSATIAASGFSFSFPGLLEDGVAYRVRWFADISGDALCSFADDHVWEHDIAAVSADVSVNDAHDFNYAEVCDSFDEPAQTFDLTFTGSGYGFHNGDEISVAVIELPSGDTVDGDSMTVGSGTFSFTFVGLLEEGVEYQLDWYVDVSGDDACTNGTDHMWRHAVLAVTDDVAYNHPHDTNFTNVCASFP